FEMTGTGLAEVANPSALFLGDRKSASPGTAVFAGLEGTRPLLCEIQALVSPTSYGTPRRAVVGWDTGRLAMILAVLDARAGVGIGARRPVSQPTTARRGVVGWDTGRLAMILAVLDARAGVGIGASDVYLNVAGG